MFRLREEALIPSAITNVVIVAYTTTQARLKLYEYLEQGVDYVISSETFHFSRFRFHFSRFRLSKFRVYFFT